MKKIMSYLLAVMMLFSCISVFAEVGHGDLAAPSDWAREDIEKADALGMTTDLNVPWTRDITREQFCTLTYSMLDLALDVDWKQVPFHPFGDTENERMTALHSEGIVLGKENGLFEPDATLTREEAAVILERIADFAALGGSASTYQNGVASFSDQEDISDWALDAVVLVHKMGIMLGTDCGFEPKNGFTVEQSVATLMRMYRLIALDDQVKVLSFTDSMNLHMPTDENYMFSPLSVKIALMMAATGAAGETQQEILTATRVDQLEAYQKNTKSMLETYGQSDLLKLSVSNSIWMNQDKTDQSFSKSYQDILADIFDATSDTVTNQTVLSKINGWVNKKTEGKIPSIISEDQTDFWAMLINAVYFKGRWQNEFNKDATKADVFTDRMGKKNTVDFMNRTGFMSYDVHDGVTVVELPYQTREEVLDQDGNFVGSRQLEKMNVSMFLMMSDTAFNPEEVLSEAKQTSRFIDLSVPKFQVAYSVELSEILKQMGIQKAFTDKAEFSNMFDKGNMCLTDAIHKTYIKVDEEGTEAAAVTALGMAGTSLLPEPTVVKFDKPFTFAIRDNLSGEMLFVGSYAFAES